MFDKFKAKKEICADRCPKEILRDNKSSLYDKAFQFIVVPTMGIFCYFVILFVKPEHDLKTELQSAHLFYDISFAIFASLMLWKGNWIINKRIERWLDWRKDPVKRVIWQVAINTIFSAAFLLISVRTYLGVTYVPIESEYPSILKISLFVGILVFLLIQTIHLGAYFFHQWEDAYVESEELKRQKLQSQFDALKSQVNPHFLFNSLNALTTLIIEDQKLAVEFVNRLANVYRYILQNQYSQLVSLQDELDFIDAFIFLQKIRFGENLKVNINIPEQYRNKLIAPLSLQMLVENSIKHNVVSAERNLIIDIFVDKDSLVVKNNMQKKNHSNGSIGIGLENIKQRYEIIAQRNVEINSDTDYFTVKIPLLSIS
jgi:sensor histidine kinase YesM